MLTITVETNSAQNMPEYGSSLTRILPWKERIEQNAMIFYIKRTSTEQLG